MNTSAERTSYSKLESKRLLQDLKSKTKQDEKYIYKKALCIQTSIHPSLHKLSSVRAKNNLCFDSSTLHCFISVFCWSFQAKKKLTKVVKPFCFFFLLFSFFMLFSGEK